MESFFYQPIKNGKCTLKRNVMNKKDKQIELHSSVWMTVDEKNFGSANHVALLAKIAECGSITQAAKAVHMSYKAAWDAIDTMNNLASEPLVARLSGGKGGGGTQLTQRGKQLVKNFQIIEQEQKDFLLRLKQQTMDITEDYFLLERMNMKTSARNQFYGKVSEIKAGAVNDEVTLSLSDLETQKITAIITHESAQTLGLQLGSPVFALIKSSSVILALDDEMVKTSARNHLRGTISRIQAGAVNTEVVLDLAEGFSIAAIITNESCESLELAVGVKAAAIFKASSVILGVQSK